MSDPGPKHGEAGQHPPALVFVAVAVGGLGIGFGIAATVLMLKSQPQAPVPSATVRQPLPAPEPAPRAGPWTEELHAEVCPAPCCGGEACRVSADNAGKKGCRDGEAHCDPCASKLSCIPGACGERLQDEELGLHLSSVLERGAAGEPVDACRSGRDLWLCLKRDGESEWQCLSQREACSNQSRSPAAVVVRAHELSRSGLVFEVREGAPDGERLARKAEPLYRGGLQRRGLCGGFRSDLEPGPVTAFNFFLDVPPGADAPAPVRVPHRPPDAGADAAVSDAPPSPPPSAAAAVLPPPAPSASDAPSGP